VDAIRRDTLLHVCPNLFRKTGFDVLTNCDISAAMDIPIAIRTARQTIVNHMRTSEIWLAHARLGYNEMDL